MQNKSIVLKSIQFVLKDFVFDIIYWPIWWYTKGLVLVLKFLWVQFIHQENTLGVRIWAKNLLIPMFGQSDWQGRLISFFVRLANLIFRFFILLLFVFLLFLVLILYIIIPLFSVFQVARYFISFF